jgi:hypothetical protein
MHDLAAFVSQAALSGALADNSKLLCELKFGRAVDTDNKMTDVIEWDKAGLSGRVSPYPWDISKEFASVDAMAEALARSSDSIYRAELHLGNLTPTLISQLHRAPSEKNAQELALNSLSLIIGPGHVASLSSESPFFAGWLAFSFSGYGYFYPRPFTETVTIAEAIPTVRNLTVACRTIWPPSLTRPKRAEVAARRQHADMWLNKPFDLPHDWFWFTSETG